MRAEIPLLPFTIEFRRRPLRFSLRWLFVIVAELGMFSYLAGAAHRLGRAIQDQHSTPEMQVRGSVHFISYLAGPGASSQQLSIKMLRSGIYVAPQHFSLGRELDGSARQGVYDA
jgi:hypothetical protein